MAAEFIQLTGVSKNYRKGRELVRVLDKISLSIRKGDFVGLMGPSGSGKTTLLNLLGGLDKPTKGEVRVNEIAISKLSHGALTQWRSRNIGFIFQFYNLLPVLTAARNVALPLLLTSLSGSQRKKHVNTALQLVGLANRASHYPRELSGGQEQRVAIARAIVSDPPAVRRAHRRPGPRHRRRNHGSSSTAEPRLRQDHHYGHARSARGLLRPSRAAPGQGRTRRGAGRSPLIPEEAYP